MLKHKAFDSALFLSATIGLPFCAFKFLLGFLCMDKGYVPLGWTLMTWAGIDTAANAVRSTTELATGRRSSLEFCLLSYIGRLLKMTSLFLALDTFISFTIICFVLWSGWIKDLPLWGSYLWYAATTVNLISLGVVNVCNEFFQIKSSPPDNKKEL